MFQSTLSIAILIVFVRIIHGLPKCEHNQVMRQNEETQSICCYPVVCAKSQRYSFCTEDNGYDTCTSCPEGTYHLDVLNTAKMPFVFDPCVPQPSCDLPEVIFLNGKCLCDRAKGYYGKDKHNCLLSETVCSGPGIELTHDGDCKPCKEDFFKPEVDTGHICRPKTRCTDNQDIADNGTTTSDRTCRAKAMRITRESQQMGTLEMTAIVEKNQTTSVESLLHSVRSLNAQFDRLESDFRIMQKDIKILKQKRRTDKKNKRGRKATKRHHKRRKNKNKVQRKNKGMKKSIHRT